MNITKGAEKIPAQEIIKKRLLAYAKIDFIMSPNEDDYWLRVYHYDKAHIDSGHFFKIDDSGGDHYYVLFLEDGCIIKGFDHECELSPYNYSEDEPLPKVIMNHNFYHNAPPQLKELLADPSLEKDMVTFCAWQPDGNTNWDYSAPKMPDNWEDGIVTFLENIADLPEYQLWFEDYYETGLDISVVEQIYNGEQITDDLIKRLNPTGNTKEILKKLADSF